MKSSWFSFPALSYVTTTTFAFIPFQTSPPPASPYQLAYDYSGANFINNFQFYHDKDPTNGHVEYVDLATANSTGLAGFLKVLDTNATANATGPVFLGVDYKTKSPTAGRKSVRAYSVQKFNQSLVIADILHMPAPVCGTWPAYWMLGSGATWPEAGEIDILEGVNDYAINHYTLHTKPGVITANYSGTSMTGRLKTGNCDTNAQGQDRNAGCSTADAPGMKSYGDAFNDNNGGVFATLIDPFGVRIWFFERGKIPADITAGIPNPPPRADAVSTTNMHPNMTNAPPPGVPYANSTWGLPNARFDSPTNAQDVMKTHFRDMQIVINTAFCGDWAGNVWNSSSTCKALAPTCEQYVNEHPEAFEDVYWAINGIKVYHPMMGGRTGHFPPEPTGTGSYKRKRMELR